MQAFCDMHRSQIAVVALLLAAGCSGEVTSADTAEAPSLDSALARDVMLATHEPVFDSTVDDSVVPEPPLTLRVLDPIPVESTKIRSSVAAAAPIPAPAPSSSASPLLVPKPKPQKIQSPPRTRLATVPAGTVLAVEAGRRICVNSSKVGERFNATLVRALPSRGGVSLPRGARVTGEVTSLFGRLGEERLEVTLRSVTVDGKTYRVRSRITDIELDRTPGAERCIPDDGRITARLTEPLRITA